MPKCDYCDVYLTHDSMSVRKAHNAGRNHLRNVVDYYERIGHEKAQSVIDSITSSYAAEGQAHNNPMLLHTQHAGPGIGIGGAPFAAPPFRFPGGMPPPFSDAPAGFPAGVPPPPVAGAPRGLPPSFPIPGPNGLPPLPGGIPFPPPGGLPFPAPPGAGAPGGAAPPPGFPPGLIPQFGPGGVPPPGMPPFQMPNGAAGIPGFAPGVYPPPATPGMDKR
ncbi:hypothetical protein TD95_000449 [Thielaviopsis punctulata]|uniref:U1 small nuclear ribonucleoprotein C n=1 Tax=Thielaviopsis punctulata TaxID=72032 RepID=A0A0F4ZJ11_9PEZI|nr:hypothetical protein TD95_000449 [Thielaviopsis punctulata]